MRANAKIIAIEGIDGSGKATQAKLLADRLEADNLQIAKFSFPNYNSPSGRVIKEYLTGELGNPEEFNPYEAAKLFADDRAAMKTEIKEAIRNNDIVIMDRYVISNLAHQGYKIAHQQQRHDFYNMVLNLEYSDNEGCSNIPKADFNIILHVPATVAQNLIGKKNQREYLAGQKHDLHEESIHHLSGASEAYTELATWLPQAIPINCAPNGKLMTVEEISDKIYQTVKALIN